MVGHGHMQAIASSGRHNLAAVCDSDPEKLRQAARYHPDAAYSEYKQMLQQSGLDYVVVATHVDMHHPITVEALEHGLHVLCEKPMADSEEHCLDMIQAAEKRNRLLAVNFNTRSSPYFLQVKGLIDAGELGPIRVVRIVYDWSCHQWRPPERLDQFMRNGGPIVDSGVHFFEAVRWFTGREFDRIDACGVILPPYENPQHVIASCRLTDGAIALIEAGWLYTKNTKDSSEILTITVIGDNGTIDYDYRAGTIRYYTKAETRILEAGDTEKHFDIVHEYFAECIQAGSLTRLASGYDGYMATKAALRALASAKGR
jgi:predicted dehydrogenase